MEYIIRPAQKQDTATISHIHAASWKAAYRGIVPQPYLDSLSDDFWVSGLEGWFSESAAVSLQMAFSGESPAGCISYGKARDESHKDWGEIISLYLLPEYFHTGCGTVLLRKALSDLESEGFTH